MNKKSGLRPPKAISGRSVSPSSDNGEVPKRFEVEDTPANLSRHSSLSSIGGSDDKTKGDDNETGQTVDHSHKSSVSPVSGDSDGGREEALLRNCISQGMPRSLPTPRPSGHTRVLRSPSTGIPSMNGASSGSNPNLEVESKKLHTEIEENEKQKLLTHCNNTITNSTSSIQSSQQAKGSPPEEGKSLDNSDPSWDSEEGRLEAVSLSESSTPAVLAEALLVAKDVSKDCCDDLMTQSTSSACLDLINPPSAMGSVLSLSSNSLEEVKTYVRVGKKSMECRHTKKRPEVVRRAMADQEYTNGDGGSLASSCHSNLDNIFPPSLVGDDMESSMISVASITSEVCDIKDSPLNLSLVGTEALNDIVGHARQIASYLQKEAQLSSTATLCAEETSTCQEITDFEETMAVTQADEVASDTELAADDLPIDIPDLPQDSPLRSGTPSSAKGSPRVTPRAQHSQDRFKTFTRDRSSSGSGKGTPDHPRSPATPRTPRQRRVEDADRYRTKTISCDLKSTTSEIDQKTYTVAKDEEKGKIVPVQNDCRRSSSFKQRRQENPSRFQTRTINCPVIDFSKDIVEFNDDEEEDISLTQAQIEALSQDANIVICSLNENREGMTVSSSGGDMFAEENILDIETLSLISNDEDEEMMQLLSSEISLETPRKPRIVKPGEEQSRLQEEDIIPAEKIIRGRRRNLYPTGGQSPAPMSCTTAKSNVLQSVRSPRNTYVKSSVVAIQPRPTRASTLRQNKTDETAKQQSTQNTSPSNSSGSSPKLSAASSRSSSKSSSKSVRDLPYPLKRQNTFTKEDEAEAASTPENFSKKTEVSQQIKNPIRNRVLRKDVVQPAMSNRSSSQEWSPPRGVKAKSLSLPRDAQPPTPEWNDGTKKSKGVKKDVTNRIANLWKKVEKAQTNKKGNTKSNDDRVWIGGAKSQPMKPIVRSSTFEKQGGSQRSGLGLKLSRLRGRDTRSSPPSGATTPNAPRPYCLESPVRVNPPKLRPFTHPPGNTPRTPTENGEKEKRLSRLGSFIVVDEQDGSTSNSSRDSSTHSRIPKSFQNDSRDDNGNSTSILNQ